MANELASETNDVARQEDGPERMRPRRVYRPLTDIYEKNGAVFVVIEMPGATPESVDVTLEKRVLTIRGQTPARPRDAFRQVHAEYGEGDYERAFTLSDEIDRDAMKAQFVNGVLTLELPKAPESQPRRIEVKTA